jgi:hypothetical protein
VLKIKQKTKQLNIRISPLHHAMLQEMVNVSYRNPQQLNKTTAVELALHYYAKHVLFQEEEEFQKFITIAVGFSPILGVQKNNQNGQS